MDVIELLQHDHRMVEQLMRDYHAAGGPPGGDGQRRGVVDVTIRELSKHAALEETLFYPFAKEVLPDGDEVVGDRLSLHMEIKRTLLALDKLDESDEQEHELMDRLREQVERHVSADEDDLMPRLRDAADEESLTEMGEVIDAGKATAPTRPHPAAPDEPPVLPLAAPVVAIYDRLRDRIQGRPRT